MEKYLKDILEKQDEKIDQIRDTMLWRTKEFKTMVVEWEIANEKAKAMESYLQNYILDSDKAHGKSMEWRDNKIENQAKRIEELEHVSSKLSYPERMKKLIITNRDLRGKLIDISKKDHIKELETFELDNIKLKNANKLAHERIKELESMKIFHTNGTKPDESYYPEYDEDPEFYDESFIEDPRDYPEEVSE